MPHRNVRGPAIIGHDQEAWTGSDCRAMRAVLERVRTVAPTRATVLLTGETGVGKGVMSKLIHHWSNRREGPFVAVHCAAVPETLLESELFGHERGAFTGAHRRKPGKFELAHGGTLFLDEVGTIPPAAQIKLLDVLQERSFHRVGGEEDVAVDVRIVAASNIDLDQAQRDGRFRPDLFHRLNVFPIEIPPLRERTEDVPALTAHLLERLNGLYGKSVAGLDPLVEAAFCAYAWPGNVRELENVLERALILEQSERITPRFIPLEILRSAGVEWIPAGATGAGGRAVPAAGPTGPGGSAVPAAGPTGPGGSAVPAAGPTGPGGSAVSAAGPTGPGGSAVPAAGPTGPGGSVVPAAGPTGPGGSAVPVAGPTAAGGSAVSAAGPTVAGAPGGATSGIAAATPRIAGETAGRGGPAASARAGALAQSPAASGAAAPAGDATGGARAVIIAVPITPEKTLHEMRGDVLAAAERRYLVELLKAQNGRINASARVAGVTTRQLRKLLNRHGIEKDDFKSPRSKARSTTRSSPVPGTILR